MSDKALRVLLVEDNQGDALLLKMALEETAPHAFEVRHVLRLAEAAQPLRDGEAEMVLLDLSLPDGTGLQTVQKVRAVAPDVPIIVLTGLVDESFALLAMREGAQDYLIKGQSSGPLIVRSIRYALERQRIAQERKQAEEAVRRSEQYFRRLTENSLDIITILDADGTIRYETPSVQEVFGYSPLEYRGRNAFQFVHPEDMPAVQKAFKECLQIPGDTPVMSFRFRHKDGTWRLLEGKGNNLLDDPVVAGIVFNLRDITERKRLEEQFVQAQKVQAIGHLAGGVAHDFNNLLTIILGYSDVLGLRLPPEHAGQTIVSEMKKAALRGATLTRQLLAFSRKQVLQPKVLNLNEVVKNLRHMLRRLIGEHIELVTMPKADPSNVNVDPGQIEQVIMNLVVNARDAMPEGGRIEIETTNVILTEAHQANMDFVPGPYVLLRVNDTGCGMTEAVRSRLFEPFFTTKELGKGTGLGLATCYGIIKQSGGHITVDSEVGHGSAFNVYLPRTDQIGGATVELEESALPKGTERILLVEDEPALRNLAASVLRECGYSVREACNGKVALDLITQNPAQPIDLLVTDVIMPQMGGVELATSIRKLYPKTKVLFCSGYTHEMVSQQGILQTSSAFLQKPLTASALAWKVREVLELTENG